MLNIGDRGDKEESHQTDPGKMEEMGWTGNGRVGGLGKKFQKKQPTSTIEVKKKEGNSNFCFPLQRQLSKTIIFYSKLFCFTNI